jgi:hypothetical protein
LRITLSGFGPRQATGVRRSPVITAAAGLKDGDLEAARDGPLDKRVDVVSARHLTHGRRGHRNAAQPFDQCGDIGAETALEQGDPAAGEWAIGHRPMIAVLIYNVAAIRAIHTYGSGLGEDRK